MAYSFRVTPETRSLAFTILVLFTAYAAVHWRYYVYVFPRVVLTTLDPRHQTLLPRTTWGLIVRLALLYYLYRSYPGFTEWLRRQRSKRQGGTRYPNADPRVAAAERRRQQRLQEQEQLEATDAISGASSPISGGTSLQRDPSPVAGASPAPTAPSAAVAGVKAAAATKQAAVKPLAAPASPPAAAAPTASAGSRDGGAAEQEERQQAWLARLQARQDQAAAEKARASAEAAAKAAAEKAPAAAAAAAAPQAAAPAEKAAAAEARAPTAKAAATAAGGSGDAGAVKRRGSSGMMHGSDSGVALPRAVSGSSMVSLREAQEAEERQRQWLQQLSSPLTPLQQEAMKKERQLKAEQDAAYEASLAEDRRRAEERAAAQAAAEAEAAAVAAAAAAAEERAEVERRRLETLRLELRNQLLAEPERDDGAVVLVRVRLPDGCSHTRRFAREAPVQQIRDWLQSLESFPLWDPARWSLVNSYPRQVLGSEGGPETVADVAHDAKQVALFVQEH